MSPSATDDPQEVVLGMTGAERLGAVVAIAAAGAAVGFLLPWILELLARLPWAPFSGPLRLLEALDDLLPVGPVVIGAAIGGALALVGTARSATLVVSATGLTISVHGDEQFVPRGGVADVFRDGEDVVVLGGDGREVARAEVDAKTPRIAEVLESHGYPWRLGDPRPG